MFANSARFQTLCETTTVADTLRHCHYSEASLVDPTLQKLQGDSRPPKPPRCIITDHADKSEYMWKRDTTTGHKLIHTLQGSIDLVCPDERKKSVENIYDWFFHQWYTIITDIMVLSVSRADSGIPSRKDPDNANRSFLVIESITKREGPEIVDVAERPAESFEVESKPETWLHVAFEFEYL